MVNSSILPDQKLHEQNAIRYVFIPLKNKSAFNCPRRTEHSALEYHGITHNDWVVRIFNEVVRVLPYLFSNMPMNLEWIHFAKCRLLCNFPPTDNPHPQSWQFCTIPIPIALSAFG